MTRAFGRAKRANPNSDALIEERALSAETGGVVGRESRVQNKHISPDHEPNMPAKGQTRALAAR